MRSCASGTEILPCKILISPRPLTTPRSVLITKANEKCAELMRRIIDHGQPNEGTTPRSVLIGSDLHLARSCPPLWFKAGFLCLGLRVFETLATRHADRFDLSVTR